MTSIEFSVPTESGQEVKSQEGTLSLPTVLDEGGSGQVDAYANIPTRSTYRAAAFLELALVPIKLVKTVTVIRRASCMLRIIEIRGAFRWEIWWNR